MRRRTGVFEGRNGRSIDAAVRTDGTPPWWNPAAALRGCLAPCASSRKAATTDGVASGWEGPICRAFLQLALPVTCHKPVLAPWAHGTLDLPTFVTPNPSLSVSSSPSPSRCRPVCPLGICASETAADATSLHGEHGPNVPSFTHLGRAGLREDGPGDDCQAILPL